MLLGKRMTEIYRQFIGVAMVLATLMAALWFLKGRGLVRWRSPRAVSGEDLVTVLQLVPLTPQHTLHVVGVGRRRLLVTSSPGSCQLISEVLTESGAFEHPVTARRDLT